MAYLTGIAAWPWFVFVNGVAAQRPEWTGTWNLLPAYVGAAAVMLFSYLAESSVFQALGGGLFFAMLCWFAWIGLPPTLSMLHREALKQAHSTATVPIVSTATISETRPVAVPKARP